MGASLELVPRLDIRQPPLFQQCSRCLVGLVLLQVEFAQAACYVVSARQARSGLKLHLDLKLIEAPQTTHVQLADAPLLSKLSVGSAGYLAEVLVRDKTQKQSSKTTKHHEAPSTKANSCSAGNPQFLELSPSSA